MKTLDRLDVVRDGDAISVFAEARSFLHHQVRSMVGSLKLVGDGKWHPSEMRRALEARDRTRCGPVAPPSGLYLTDVIYPRADHAPDTGVSPIDPATDAQDLKTQS